MVNFQENINIVNIYVPNIAPNKYIKQILRNIKGVIDKNTIIVGDINKETWHLSYILDQIDLTDIYEPFNPIASDYTFFSSIKIISSRMIIC